MDERKPLPPSSTQRLEIAPDHSPAPRPRTGVRTRAPRPLLPHRARHLPRGKCRAWFWRRRLPGQQPSGTKQQPAQGPWSRGLHSSPFQLNLRRFSQCLTDALQSISQENAQVELKETTSVSTCLRHAQTVVETPGKSAHALRVVVDLRSLTGAPPRDPHIRGLHSSTLSAQHQHLFRLDTLAGWVPWVVLVTKVADVELSSRRDPCLRWFGRTTPSVCAAIAPPKHA